MPGHQRIPRLELCRLDPSEVLQDHLGDSFAVRMSFQYSAPFTPDALKALSEDGIDKVNFIT